MYDRRMVDVWYTYDRRMVDLWELPCVVAVSRVAPHLRRESPLWWQPADPEMELYNRALFTPNPFRIEVNTTSRHRVVRDSLTKFSKVILLENQEAATVAKFFVTRVVTKNGILEKVLTDQGMNFTSETTACHPESNGALERLYGTLVEYLQHYINETQADWDELLPYAKFAYNTTPHTATGFTLFELISGYRATIPTALTKPPKETYSYEDYAQELQERIRATNQIAKENVQKAKIQYDKSAHKKEFRMEDQVLLHDETARRER
ncbi:uncharacterized protein LOC105202535 [Solenopsis invicta]|uniref:uncharacterized protein LOC105202535 n=1 Tax=Solenopsis invicta TaxID=13686 RepID=UPI000595FC71|nr:uncharacterized protein LOC105202535 [Solenopsis invicta]